MKKIAVIAAKRSPIGKVPGELSSISETELLAYIFQKTAAPFQKMKIDEAITGASFPLEKDNLSRKAIQMAGFPTEISAATVSKTCASSDEALSIACCKILSGKSRAVLVGGIEKISNSPYTLKTMKQDVKRSLSKKMPAFHEIVGTMDENDMVYINEMLARQYHITREEQDIYCIDSIQKARSAAQNGYFKSEIIPVKYMQNDQVYSLAEDEMLSHERPEQKIKQAEPMFLKDGCVTRYNAAPVCDCCAAVLVADEDYAKECGYTPAIEIKDTVSIGTEKEKMGHAMGACTQYILKKNGLSLSQIDLVELNDPFAVQALFTISSLKIDARKVNINGGNLALGYPIGATGLRMDVTLIHEMTRKRCRFGLSVMSAGGNMAQATLFEKAVSLS